MDVSEISVCPKETSAGFLNGPAPPTVFGVGCADCAGAPRLKAGVVVGVFCEALLVCPKSPAKGFCTAPESVLAVSAGFCKLPTLFPNKGLAAWVSCAGAALKPPKVLLVGGAACDCPKENGVDALGDPKALFPP
jgi:hypothetical protein